MHRHTTLAAALFLMLGAASHAEDAKLEEGKATTAPQPAPNQAMIHPRQSAPKLDLSRPVTLTGAELDAIIRAQVLAARAKDAQEAVAPLTDRLRGAMSVPAEDSPKDGEAPKP